MLDDMDHSNSYPLKCVDPLLNKTTHKLFPAPPQGKTDVKTVLEGFSQLKLLSNVVNYTYCRIVQLVAHLMICKFELCD